LPTLRADTPIELNEMLIETRNKIFEWVKFQHQTRFPKDSKVIDDPVIIACNAYNLTMNYCIGLMGKVIEEALELQARFDGGKD